MTTAHAMFKVTLLRPPTEAVVEEIMDRLISKHPQIRGYAWEPVGDNTVNILIYQDTAHVV